MVSTRSRAGANKQVDAGPSGPPSITDEGLSCFFLRLLNMV